MVVTSNRACSLSNTSATVGCAKPSTIATLIVVPILLGFIPIWAITHATCGATTSPATADLGHTIFVQTEFQVLDRETDESNETGDASHRAYKERQKLAVMRRLKVGRFNMP